MEPALAVEQRRTAKRWAVTCTTDGSLALNHDDTKTGLTGGGLLYISYREAGPDALNVHCAQATATVTPQLVGGSALDTGVGQHSLRMKCWGENLYGNLGDGTSPRDLHLSMAWG